MKELLEVIAKRLVEHPEQVVVAETNNCKGNPHCGKSRRHP